jgi:hypothetical protein
MYLEKTMTDSFQILSNSSGNLPFDISLTTDSLTHSWRRALLEKLPIVQLLENFPAFYGTRRFITAFT